MHVDTERAETLPERFERAARRMLADEPVQHHWAPCGPRRRRLVLPVQSAGGFEIAIEAEQYGLYAFAGDGWHSPAWDVTPVSGPDEVVGQCLGFVRTLLSTDAELEVRSAGGSPYRWTLRYKTESGPDTWTTGLLVFNYAGTRTTETFQNRVLPARY